MREENRPELSLAKEAYDKVAGRYDLTVGQNPINTWMRLASTAWLLKSFRLGNFVLEIGCGTGDEALGLARHGIRVLACDLSDEMVRQTTRKATAQGLSSSVRARQLAAQHIDTLVSEFGEHSFDGAFSSFALTYVPDLKPVAKSLSWLLKTGSNFVCSIRNKFCLLEILGQLVALHPSRALARLAPTSWFSVGESRIPVKSYTLRGFASIFKEFFSVEEALGLPVFLPPSEWANWYMRAGRISTALTRADFYLRDKHPFKHLGDHLLIRMKRL